MKRVYKYAQDFGRMGDLECVFAEAAARPEADQ